MKAVIKKNINWLDIAVISFVLFLIVLFLVPLTLTYFIASYFIIFAVVSVFFYVLRVFNKSLSVGFDARVNSINWIAIVIVVLGSLMIVNLLSDVTQNWRYQPVALVILAGGGLIIGLFYLLRWRKKSKVAMDERVKDITNRSSRNALIATWLGLFIVGGSHFGWVGTLGGMTAYRVNVELIGSGDLLAIALVGFIAFIVSLLIYRKRADFPGGGK
jgi:hypothetical protein